MLLSQRHYLEQLKLHTKTETYFSQKIALAQISVTVNKEQNSPKNAYIKFENRNLRQFFRDAFCKQGCQIS